MIRLDPGENRDKVYYFRVMLSSLWKTATCSPSTCGHIAEDDLTVTLKPFLPTSRTGSE